MSIAKCDREKKMTAAFGAVTTLAALGAAKNAVKIAATPLDPLGLPKLPFRVAKLGVFTALAVAAGVVTVSRCERRAINDRIRNCLRPDKTRNFTLD